MSRPSDIPQDVLNVAIALVREQQDAETVARAILAERERCAKIADSACQAHNRAGYVVALSISRAIRKGGE